MKTVYFLCLISAYLCLPSRGYSEEAETLEEGISLPPPNFLVSLGVFPEAALTQRPSHTLTKDKGFISSYETEVELSVDPAVSDPKLSNAQNVSIATTLSALFPGLGQLYLGEYKQSIQLSSSYLFGISTAISGAIEKDYSLLFGGAMIASTSSNYGLYAAYRDARRLVGEKYYTYQMPQDSFFDLASAPFKPSILTKPQVWGGILGGLAAGGAVYFFGSGNKSSIYCSTGEHSIFPLLAIPIGISEESLFRGFIQSELSENFNPTVGIILSSLLFGIAHIPNALLMPEQDRWKYYAYSIPFISAFGGYMGWVTNKTHSLQESVAIHTWYDFILFLRGYLTSSASIGSTPSFNLTFKF